MSFPSRQLTGQQQNVNSITTIISQKKDNLRKLISECLEHRSLFKPNKIDISTTNSGSYINLIYSQYNMTLTFVSHLTHPDHEGNRMHCKVIKDDVIIGYSGVYLDDNYRFMFKYKGDYFFEVQNNQFYFFCIFDAINSLYQGGGKKNNIQINLNNYNVSELKNICRNYKIKNYSKLNKVDLILLIKKNKKLFK